MITYRNILIFVVILLTSWLAVRLLHDYRLPGSETDMQLISDNVDLTLKNIQYTKNRDGRPVWTLVADSAAHSMGDNITRIKNVRMVFFGKEIGDIVLTADLGELLPEYRMVTVSSNVLVTDSPGNSLRTDYLEYQEAGNILQTDTVVHIIMDDFTVSGKGMQMDVLDRTLVLLSDVRARFETLAGP